MRQKQNQYAEEEILKTSNEIVLEVLGHGSGYIKGLGYGPKPPNKRGSQVASQQIHKELAETQKKLDMSESHVKELQIQVQEFETEVSKLKDQLTNQGSQLSTQDADIKKLMEIMAANGMIH